MNKKCWNRHNCDLFILPVLLLAQFIWFSLDKETELLVDSERNRYIHIPSTLISSCLMIPLDPIF